MPAAPPASRKCDSSRGSRKPNQRPNTCIRLAPTCTVGPSRPTDAPPSSDKVVSASLPTDTRSDRLVSRKAGSGCSSAAITCGMPLPRVGRNAPEVSQASSAKMPGVSSSAHQMEWAVMRWNRWKAASLALANTMATSATAMAPPHRATRRRQPSLDNSGRSRRGEGSGADIALLSHRCGARGPPRAQGVPGGGVRSAGSRRCGLPSLGAAGMPSRRVISG